MIQFNLIPENLRKEKSGLFEQLFGDLPREFVVGIVVAALGLALAVHLILGLVFVMKLAQYQLLQGRWNSMAADKKALDDVMNETKALQLKMNTLRPITAAGTVRWSELLGEVTGSVRKGVWLREIGYQKDLLSIAGSAVSRTKGDMGAAYKIISILNEKPNFKNYFQNLEIDSIQRRGNPALSITDFSLKAKRK